ncbi:MAG: cytochrome c3 family protein [Bacteroidales bacterium]
MIVKFRARILNIHGHGYFLISFLVLLLMVYVYGCSPVKHHKTLAFFFDGVPSPQANDDFASRDSVKKPDSITGKSLQKAGKPQPNYHKPYKEKHCDACHDQGTMGKFVIEQPMLCYQCHADFSKKYKVVHGPVAGGFCTLCHEPHSSVNRKLLKRVDQQLCFYCHTADIVLNTKAHANIADTSCTDCHNPHGGNDRTFLK